MRQASKATPSTAGAAALTPLELHTLSQNLEQFRLLVENSQDVVAEVTLDGRFLYVSPNVRRLLGYEPRELLTTSVFEHVHPEDISQVRAQFALPEGAATCRYRHKDGSWRWLETSGRDFFNPQGQKRGVLIVRDVTGRKNAEEALRQSEERVRAIFENALDAVVTISSDGDVTGWNAQAEKLFGWPRAEVIGKPVSGALIPERLRKAHEQGLKHFLHAHQTSVLNRRLELTVLHRDGHEIPVELAVTSLRTTEGISFCGFIRDLTGPKEDQRAKALLEAQLRQAQKLEAVGTLASGIAHDFNNILAVILAYTELACMDLDKPADVRKYLAEVGKAGERARDLVRQILTFSRHQKHERKPTHLDLVIEEALKLLRSTLPATLEIDAQIESETAVVLADPTQIHQVMMNLCMNAAHAMQGRPGRLTVNLRNADASEAQTHGLLGAHGGRYVRLVVSDTGHGMDAETLKCIFEPFFTTKPPGEGTGLGLRVVHDIVKGHDGVIAVQSQPGSGTTFELFFPEYQFAASEPAELSPPLPRGTQQRILFVDDEIGICDSARAGLERLGYQVTAHTDPQAALEQFTLHPEAYELAIVDLTMPKMTGVDFARHVLALRPRLPVLLSSGFSDSWTREKLRELGIFDLIPKPATVADLGHAVSHALALQAPG